MVMPKEMFARLFMIGGPILGAFSPEPPVRGFGWLVMLFGIPGFIRPEQAKG